MTDSFRIMPGETLLAYSPGLISDGATQTMLGDRIRAMMQIGETNPLAAIRRDLADFDLNHERGAMTLMRQ